MMYELYAIVDKYCLNLLYCSRLKACMEKRPPDSVRGQKQSVNAMLGNEVFAIVQASILSGW